MKVIRYAVAIPTLFMLCGWATLRLVWIARFGTEQESDECLMGFTAKFVAIGCWAEHGI